MHTLDELNTLVLKIYRKVVINWVDS